jgi:hypothetical protein
VPVCVARADQPWVTSWPAVYDHCRLHAPIAAVPVLVTETEPVKPALQSLVE